jgi:hypothetical protein
MSKADQAVKHLTKYAHHLVTKRKLLAGMQFSFILPHALQT